MKFVWIISIMFSLPAYSNEKTLPINTSSKEKAPIQEAGFSNSSGVTINDFRCDKVKNIITGSVTTGNDNGGASYKLTFRGDDHTYQRYCDVLETLKQKNTLLTLK